MFVLPFFYPAAYGYRAYKSTCIKIPKSTPSNTEIAMKSYIQNFLDAQGIRKDLIIMEQKNQGFCEALGTNFFTKGNAVVSVAPDFFKTDRDAYGWVMKHEICHIKNNDPFTMLLVPAICSLAAVIFANYMMLNIFPIIVISLVVSSISLNIFSQCREKKADDLAVEFSTTQELIGGQRLIKSYQIVNKKCWEIGNFTFSSSGENRLDFMHPSFASRLHLIIYQ